MSTTVPTLLERLEILRTCSGHDIRRLCESIAELCTQLPMDFIHALSDTEQVLCLRTSLICWGVTSGRQVPRVMQLRAVMADYFGRNSLISAGTGSGKTLPIALNILLDDPSKNQITLTISPLKRLQSVQQQEFQTRYGIRTYAINEDTPREESWWTSNIFHSQKTIETPAQHLIVTVEQLFKTREGHLPRLGALIRNPHFQKRIKRINIDEAHFIYTAGVPLYGKDAFRPAWGLLSDLKVVLRSTILWHLFSATFPPHILTHIKDNLLRGTFDYILQSSNRPNTTYATHMVPARIDDPRNYTCFLGTPFDPNTQPHVLIFADNKEMVTNITDYLDSTLPPEYQGRGVVQHYHASMSQLYLDRVHNDFISPTGTCKVLVTTSGQSVGVDFPNVKIVVTVGLPTNIVDALQRGGRGIRTGDEIALFIVFYESWALDIEEHEFMGGSDPDRPRAPLGLASRAQERAPLSSVRLVQSKDCIRQFFGVYLNDTDELALKYTGTHCCDRHGDGFKLQDYLPGPIFTDQEDDTTETLAVSNDIAPRLRPKPERILLEAEIMQWLDIQVANDPTNRPAYEILSFEQTKQLLRLPRGSIASVDNLVDKLDENDDWKRRWGSGLFSVVSHFDSALPQPPPPRSQIHTASTSFPINQLTFQFENFPQPPPPSSHTASPLLPIGQVTFQFENFTTADFDGSTSRKRSRKI